MRHWSDGWPAIRARSEGAPVTLFNDTFTNHYEPEIGIAAIEVLERGGCACMSCGPAAAAVL